MKIKNRTVDEVVEKLAFDGMEEDVNNSIKYYYFCCDDLEESKDIFYELYEDDILDFVARTSEEEYDTIGCVVCLEMDSLAEVVTNIFITAQVEYEDGRLELEPIEINGVDFDDDRQLECEEWVEDLVDKLLKKVN